MMDEKTGYYNNAKGGTELMRERILSHLDTTGVQIICSRLRELEEGKKKIFWAHDYFTDPENQFLQDPEIVKQIDKFVFVSHQQFTTYNVAFGIPYNKSVVIENCIDPIEGVESNPTDEIKLIYHTTPHRGLEILVPVFEKLCETHKNITLDVYSSFNIYGWGERDAVYEPVFDRCRNHPKINYHGTVSNAEVREALKKAHIFAFPSIWPETSCLAAIEAMSAECLVVCPDLAALSETVGMYGLTYRFDEDHNKHANKFYYALDYAIRGVENKHEDIEARLKLAKNRVNMKYNTARSIVLWNNLLNELKS